MITRLLRQLHWWNHLLIWCLAISANASTDVLLIDQGKLNCTILVRENAPKVIQDAVHDLVYHFERMSNVIVPVVAEASKVKGASIIIGVSSEESIQQAIGPIDTKDYWPNGYMIATTGQRLVLTAPSPIGVRNAIYGLLEDHLGCHWFTIGRIGEHIPKRATVSLRIPGGVEIVQPFHEIRLPWYSSLKSIGPDLSAANKAGSTDQMLFKIRNRMEMRGYYGHYWYKIYTDEVFTQYPDLAPFYDGKRHPSAKESGGQICMSNPHAAEVAAKYFIEYFNDNPSQDFFSFVANDGGGWCECENCEAMATTYAGRMVLLANQVLNKLNEVHPDKRLAVNIYVNTFSPPASHIKAHPNLIGVFCRAWFSEAEGWMDQTKPIKSDHPDMLRYRKSLETWMGDVELKTAFKHDYVNFYPGPYTMYRKLQDDHDYYTKIGVTGDVSEYYYRHMGTDVHMWLSLRLAWDKSLTVDQLLSQFYPDYFGEAGEDMRKVYERLEKHMSEVQPVETHHAVHISVTFDLYPIKLLNHCLKLIASAKEKVKANPLHYARVVRDENLMLITYLMAKSYKASQEYYESNDPADQNQADRYAQLYFQKASENEIDLPIGVHDLLASFTFDKLGSFNKRDWLSYSRGSTWRAKSISGFFPGKEEGLRLKAKEGGEIVYEIQTSVDLKFKEVKLKVHFMDVAVDCAIHISTDNGKHWTSIDSLREKIDISSYVQSEKKFLIKFTARNPMQQEIMAIYNWAIEGTVTE